MIYANPLQVVLQGIACVIGVVMLTITKGYKNDVIFFIIAKSVYLHNSH